MQCIRLVLKVNLSFPPTWLTRPTMVHLLQMESGLFVRLTHGPQQTKELLLFEQLIRILSQLQLLAKVLYGSWLT